MNSKSIQNTWCYRYKLLSLWIISIDILGFFYIHCILKMCYKNTLAQGWGGGLRLKRIFEYRVGWGIQKWPFWGVHTLWMAPCAISHEDCTISHFLFLVQKLMSRKFNFLEKVILSSVFTLYFLESHMTLHIPNIVVGRLWKQTKSPISINWNNAQFYFF